jgi:hypothetical protein
MVRTARLVGPVDELRIYRPKIRQARSTMAPCDPRPITKRGMVIGIDLPSIGPATSTVREPFMALVLFPQVKIALGEKKETGRRRQ